MKSKTIVVSPLVPWFNDEFKPLKLKKLTPELVWRWSRNHETLLSFHHTRNIFVVNALHNKHTAHLSQLVSNGKVDSKKCFALINVLCGKKQSTPLPDHDSVENLVNVSGNVF